MAIVYWANKNVLVAVAAALATPLAKNAISRRFRLTGWIDDKLGKASNVLPNVLFRPELLIQDCMNSTSSGEKASKTTMKNRKRPLRKKCTISSPKATWTAFFQ
jgi:hypothetical protein